MEGQPLQVNTQEVQVTAGTGSSSDVSQGEGVFLPSVAANKEQNQSKRKPEQAQSKDLPKIRKTKCGKHAILVLAGLVLSSFSRKPH